MRIYLNDNDEQLFDRYSLRRILGVSRSKVHRELNRITDKEEVVYKNQYLYDEQTLFQLMEQVLIERLNKMKGDEYGL
jgi:hypothetical protein